MFNESAFKSHTRDVGTPNKTANVPRLTARIRIVDHSRKALFGGPQFAWCCERNISKLFDKYEFQSVSTNA